MRTLQVIIVAYEEVETLRRCIDSVLGLRGVRTAITIVDNSDQTERVRHLVTQEFGERIDYVQRSDNPGFGVASNLGFKRGTSDFVLFLNPDCIVNDEAVDACLETLNDPHAGLVGPALYDDNGKFDHACKRGFPTVVASVIYLGGKGVKQERIWSRSGYLAPQLGRTEVGEVFALNGAFMMARRSTIDQVGGFDERFWMYAEDLDLCKRVWDLGYSVTYRGDVSVVHLKGATTNSEGTRRGKPREHFVTSMRLFVEKWSAEYRFPQFVIAVIRASQRSGQ